ncbi:hypothetical protein DITRI_Ditri19aG0010200 [Diplodiscus trichospermus]
MAEEIIVSRIEMNDLDEMREAYAKVLKNDHQGLTGICQKNPDALFKAITAGGDTIFHIAAYEGRVRVLQALVKMVPPSKKHELLKMKNKHGNTILHEMAASKNKKAAEILIGELLYSEAPTNIDKRKEILADQNKLGETPLFRAAGWGNKEMMVHLAGEIERFGNLCSHYKRGDGVSILHIAVIGLHFGVSSLSFTIFTPGLNTAIWLLQKDRELATCKDNNGNTCLQLLASMPAAFSASSPTNGIFSKAIYYCLPNNSLEEDETLNPQNKDLEQGELSKGPDQSGPSKENCMAINLEFPGIGFKEIGRIWDQKKMHESAVQLARILVERDASWFKRHESEESDTICLKRNGEEEGVKNSAASGTKKSPEPETPLFVAASTGIVEIVREILDRYPQAVEYINKKGQNILHVAILHHKYKVFNFVKKKYPKTKKLVNGIDNYGCTILHYAADNEHYHGGTKLTPPLYLQKELRWFEVVKKDLPSRFTMHLNKKNKTADQLFNDKHQKQLETAQEWVKNTCQSCSTVAVLVAGGVFAAAYQPPGGFEKGRSVLQEKPLYSLFAVMDVAALASSLTSVVIFLSVLTSSLEFQDFISPIPRHLSTGFIFLFFSVGTTMLTFTATILLLVEMKLKTQSLTYAAALLPICVFALFQFPLFHSYIVATIDNIADYLERNLPGKWEAHQIKDD